MRFFGTLRALRPLELLRAFDLLWLVGPLEARAVKLGLAVVLPMCVLVLMVLVRTLQVAELEAQLVRDLTPSHPAGAQLEHAGHGDALAGLRRDRAAVERRLDLLGRGVANALLGERGLRQRERVIDIAPAHLAGRRREARGLAALREVDLRVVPQAVDELAGVPFGPGE